MIDCTSPSFVSKNRSKSLVDESRFREQRPAATLHKVNLRQSSFWCVGLQCPLRTCEIDEKKPGRVCSFLVPSWWPSLVLCVASLRDVDRVMLICLYTPESEKHDCISRILH
jgi:hypothetical protein